MQSLKVPYHLPCRADMNWEKIEDAESLLSELISRFNIKFPPAFPTFTDFFTCLESRYKKEVDLHKRILDEEKFITDLVPPLSQISNYAIIDQSNKCIENDIISYDATDFLVLLANNGNMQKNRFLREKLKIIFDSLQQPFPSKTPCNISTDKKVNLASYEAGFRNLLVSFILNEYTPIETKVKVLETFVSRKIQIHYDETLAKMEQLKTKYNATLGKLRMKNIDLKKELKNQMKYIKALQLKVTQISQAQDITLNYSFKKLFKKGMDSTAMLSNLNKQCDFIENTNLRIALNVDDLLKLGMPEQKIISLVKDITSSKFPVSKANKKCLQIDMLNCKIDKSFWDNIGKISTNVQTQLRIRNVFLDRITLQQMAPMIKDPNAKIEFFIENFKYTDDELITESMEALGKLYNKTEALNKGMQFDVLYAAVTTSAANSLCSALQRLKIKPKLYLNINLMRKLTEGEFEALVNLLKLVSSKSDLTFGLSGEKWAYEEATHLVIFRKKPISIRFSSNASAEIIDLTTVLKNRESLDKLELDFRSNNQANEENVEKLVNLISSRAFIKDLTLDLRGNPISINQLQTLNQLIAINNNYKILFDYFTYTLTFAYFDELKTLSEQLHNFKDFGKLELNATNIVNGNQNSDYQIITSIHDQINQLKFQCNKQLKINKFNYSPGSSGKDEQVKKLAQVFQYTQSITDLWLNFVLGSVTNEAFGNLADSIKQMAQKSELTNLYLAFQSGSNAICNDGAGRLAAALQCMTNLAKLQLYFFKGNNCITDTAVQQIAESLKKMTKLTYLTLQLKEGKNMVTENGVNQIEKALPTMASLTSLTLYVSNDKYKLSEDTENRIKQIKQWKECRLGQDQVNSSRTC